MGGVDWIFTPQQRLPGISLTPRCMLPPSHWIAYFDEPTDYHRGELAQAKDYARGVRVHKDTWRTEECYLLCFKTSNGAEGWWATPDPNVRYEFGFHGAPRLCCHVQLEDTLDPILRAEGVHPDNFWKHIVAHELNGRRDDAEAVKALVEKMNNKYRTLTGTDFWYLEQIKARMERTELMQARMKTAKD